MDARAIKRLKNELLKKKSHDIFLRMYRRCLIWRTVQRIWNWVSLSVRSVLRNRRSLKLSGRSMRKITGSFIGKLCYLLSGFAGAKLFARLFCKVETRFMLPKAVGSSPLRPLRPKKKNLNPEWD